MKKLFILIVILLSIITSLGFAYADMESEVLFRSIPWGTSVTEFLSLVQADNLGGNVYNHYPLDSWENGEGKYMDDPVFTLEDAGYTYIAYPDASVAGIPIKQIEACFTFSYDNASIYRDEADSSLYFAEYSLEPVDIGMTFPILKEKMTSLYGEGHKESATVNVMNIGGNDYTCYFETVTWYGANNTGVRLFMEYHVDKVDGTTENKHLKLTYGKTNSADLLAAEKEALAKEEMNKVLTDTSTDGL